VTFEKMKAVNMVVEGGRKRGSMERKDEGNK
jgi:hypothetical protein